ncbi:MAG: aldo/keto reductase, partial [Brachybacterium sp.]
MRYDSLGSSGLLVSSLGIGCNAFGRRIDQDAATAVVQAALDEGVTFFDTADTYGIVESETMLGKALGARREEVV